ncbi:MAG: 50S ribosomal protein L25 [Lentisphaerae bacterium]|nr:50S ribosomal protein L25 [Lentisphaerota bacterium]
MAKEVTLNAKPRTATGSSEARRLRHQGLLPGIISTRDGQAELIQLDRHDFEVMLHHHASENMMVDVVVGDAAPRRVLLKEVQHNTLTDSVLHVDFVEVSLTEKMRVRIPVELVGEAAGVEAGGTLEHLLRELEVECLPGDLVERIEADVSGLQIGDNLLVGDLNVGSQFTVVTPSDIAVAGVAAPREEEEAEAAEAEAAEGGEPEVIGEKPEEEEQSGKSEG